MEIEQFGDWEKIIKLDGVKAFKDESNKKWYYHINEKVIDIQSLMRICGSDHKRDIEIIQNCVQQIAKTTPLKNPYTVERLLVEVGRRFDFTGTLYEVSGDFISRFESKYDYVYTLIDNHDTRHALQVEIPKSLKIELEDKSRKSMPTPSTLLDRRIAVIGRLTVNEWTVMPTIKAKHVSDLGICTRKKEEAEIEEAFRGNVCSPEKQAAFELNPPKIFKKIGLIGGEDTEGYQDFCRILKWKEYSFETIPRNVKIEHIPEVIQAIKDLRAEDRCDCICIVRGGGDAERMHLYWNSELLKTIIETQDKFQIPIITGIGHESDHPFCERVAKYGAATPTQAADFFNGIVERQKREEAAMSPHYRKGVIGMGVPPQRDPKEVELENLRAQVKQYKRTIEVLQQQIDELKSI